MSNDNPSPPIVVDDSAVPTQVMTTVRLVLGYLVAYLVGRGDIDEVTGSHLVALVVMVLPGLWSLYASYRKHVKLRIAANAAPSYIAKVK